MREGLLTLPRLKLELRTDHSRLALVGVSLMAIIASFAVGMILLAILGRSPMRVSNAFFIQPFTSLYGIGEILLKTGPLLLIAQGLAVGYRANVWNIGAEGQLTVGAIAAGVLALSFDTSNSVFLLPAMIIVGALAGAAWAAIAAFLRVRWNANEILTTFMLSSVALQLLYYLVTGPLRDPLGQNFPQSALFSDAALFGTLIPGSRANTSLLLGLAATLISYVFMQHSIHGFRLIVSGLAPRAARYAGFGEARAGMDRLNCRRHLRRYCRSRRGGRSNWHAATGALARVRVRRDYRRLSRWIAPDRYYVRRRSHGTAVRWWRLRTGVSERAKCVCHDLSKSAAGLLFGGCAPCRVQGAPSLAQQ